MSNPGYFKGYHDLINHPAVISAPHTYRWVLIVILDRMAHKPMILDDHGEQVSVLPGQLLTTIDQLALWANVDRNIVDRSLIKWNLVGIVRREQRQEKRRNGKQKKTLLTVSWNDNQVYKDYLSETKNQTRTETKSETKARRKVNNTDSSVEESSVCLFVNAQARDQENDQKEDMDKSPIIVAKSNKTATKVTTIRTNTLVLQLLEEGCSQEEINQALGIFKNTDPTLNGTIKNYLLGIVKKQRKQAEDEKRRATTPKNTPRRNSNKVNLQRTREALSHSSYSWEPDA